MQSVLSNIHISCSVASVEGLMYPIFAIICLGDTLLLHHPGATLAPPGLGPKSSAQWVAPVTLQVPSLTPYTPHTHRVRPGFLLGSPTLPIPEPQTLTAESGTSVSFKYFNHGAVTN